VTGMQLCQHFRAFVQRKACGVRSMRYLANRNCDTGQSAERM
jgi:hypothetical protein